MKFVNEIAASLSSSVIYLLTTFLPKFLAGLIILTIGIIIASLIRDLINIIFKYLKVDEWLESAHLARSKEVQVWPNLLAELARWSVVFLFLMSAVETWGIPKVGDVLSRLLLFLPNVFLAVIIGWIGLVAGRFVSDIVRHGIDGVGGREALVLGNIAKFAIYFFTSLIILNELGVAADLVKILFTGIIAMLALLFGLAFGLGGQDEARDLLRRLRLKIESQALNPRSKVSGKVKRSRRLESN